ncbi:MAG: hypothetical protein GEU71_02520 [Actinobacteria bacterium]|nr:hypothetical protein [Actinomycetota bacterium]
MRRQLFQLLAIALLAGLVPGITAARAETPITLSIAPAIAGDTAVHAGQAILVSGTAPEGPVTAATLIALEDGGTTSTQVVPSGALNRTDDGTSDFLRNDAGTLSGRLTLGCIFREPVDTCPTAHGNPRGAVLEIQIGTETGQSSPLRVDYTRPYIKGYKLVATGAIVIEFSEPVRNADGDSALDWTVTNPARTPLMIGGAGTADCSYGPGEDATAGPGGCTRRLTIQAVGEDAEPLTTFNPALIRAAYTDLASNSMLRTAGAPSSNAVDKIAPRIPTISTIDGKNAAGVVSSQNPAPAVVVNNATNGHTITLYRESSATPGFDKSQDTQLASAVVSAGSASFTLPAFASDGSYTLYALATDIHGNDSVDGAGSVAADDATYALDRIAPLPLTAKTTGSAIAVSFTEPIVGTDNASQWTVTGCAGNCTVQSVTGQGDTRVLEMTSGSVAPAGAQVAWAGGNYADAAGNVLAPFSSLASQGSVAVVVDLEPEGGTQAVAEDYTLRLTVADTLGNPVAGARVGIRAVSGPSSSTNNGSGPGVLNICTSQSDGSCTLAYRSNATGLDTVQAWVAGSGTAPSPEPVGAEDANDQDVVTVTWTAEGADIELDASPESSTGTIDDTHIVSVSVKELGSPFDTAAPASIKGVNVDLAATTGPNSGWLGQCTTDAGGLCQISYRSTVTTDSEGLQSWIDRNRDNDSSGDLFLSDAESQDADGLPVLDDPSQDVVTRTWLPGSVTAPIPGTRSVSIAADRSEVRYGKPVHLTGTVTFEEGCAVDKVAIERRLGGGVFKFFKNVPAGDGSWDFDLAPSWSARYRATVPANDSCAAAISPATFVGVKSKVTASVNRVRVKRGRCVTVRGVVAPVDRGGDIVLERKRAGTWRSVKNTKLNERSRYIFPKCFGKKGRVKLRTRSLENDSNLAGVSPQIRVRVTRR